MGVIRTVDTLDESLRLRLRDWLRSLDLQPTTGSTYVRGRGERWFRWASDLGARVYRVEEPPDFVALLGERYLSRWASLLACGGETSIRRHVDHKHFLRHAVMVHVDGYAEFNAWPRGKPPEAYQLHPGQVVELDVGIPHASRQTSPERYHLTFRRVWPHLLGGGGT